VHGSASIYCLAPAAHGGGIAPPPFVLSIVNVKRPYRNAKPSMRSSSKWPRARALMVKDEIAADHVNDYV
jgi:hypothetical protein